MRIKEQQMSNLQLQQDQELQEDQRCNNMGMLELETNKPQDMCHKMPMQEDQSLSKFNEDKFKSLYRKNAQ